MYLTLSSHLAHNIDVPKSVNAKEISLLLKQVNHPARYVGAELGSKNKNFADADITVALAFPDLYEVGISNLGLKIIYNIINAEPSFMADRVYAPDTDFRTLLKENTLELFGLESYMPLKSFDLIAFSMQYELNYTTMLGMLELSNISLLAKDRSNEDPLILAGGPSCLNPEPFADFVDLILVGDGEVALKEVLEIIQQKRKDTPSIHRNELLKALAEIEGIYIPSLYENQPDQPAVRPIDKDISFPVKKRVSPLNDALYPTETPVPNVSIVHDRPVIEVRRGCGRMCRFCQSGFATLPIRERHPETVKELCTKALDFSGYDEYSLLSLSISDYPYLSDLVSSLNKDFASLNISISLPSQRVDKFDLNLAKEIQAVRKSTLTFAPEAGTDRLRKVINKNISQEQIIEAALSAYQSGWSKVKFYFIMGLPTETYEDLDGIIDLISTIKAEANKMRGIDKSIKRPLDITCSISIFVPKPFTPFQWFGQISKDEILNRKAYLKDKCRSLKGVKLNFHDSATSALEALFARGDRSLSALVLEAYRQGAYLDSWDEYFSKRIWDSAAEACSIDINSLITREYPVDEEFPWDVISIGIDKNWLAQERAKALLAETTVPCETSCNACGICTNLDTKPVRLKDSYSFEDNKVSAAPAKTSQQKFSYRLKVSKLGNLRFISHLDWFRLLYRAVRKAKIPVAMSQGFNPSPKISLGMALGIFMESEAELMDMDLTEKVDEIALKERLNAVLPGLTQVIEVTSLPTKAPSIAQTVYWASYEAQEECPEKSHYDFESLEQTIDRLFEQETVIITKKTKSKTKELDIKPCINSVYIEKSEPKKLYFTLRAGQELNVKPDEFLSLFSRGEDWRVKRLGLMDADFQSL